MKPVPQAINGTMLFLLAVEINLQTVNNFRVSFSSIILRKQILHCIYWADLEFKVFDVMNMATLMLI